MKGLTAKKPEACNACKNSEQACMGWPEVRCRFSNVLAPLAMNAASFTFEGVLTRLACGQRSMRNLSVGNNTIVATTIAATGATGSSAGFLGAATGLAAMTAGGNDGTDGSGTMGATAGNALRLGKLAGIVPANSVLTELVCTNCEWVLPSWGSCQRYSGWESANFSLPLDEG